MNEGLKLAVRVKTELQEMGKLVEDLRGEVEQLKHQRRPREAFAPNFYRHRSTRA
jgi:hypothetical protein